MKKNLNERFSHLFWENLELIISLYLPEYFKQQNEIDNIDEFKIKLRDNIIFARDYYLSDHKIIDEYSDKKAYLIVEKYDKIFYPNKENNPVEYRREQNEKTKWTRLENFINWVKWRLFKVLE